MKSIFRINACLLSLLSGGLLLCGLVSCGSGNKKAAKHRKAVPAPVAKEVQSPEPCEMELAEVTRRAEAGASAYQYELGRRKEYGIGMHVQLLEARIWYEKSAGAGNILAKAALATLYQYGNAAKQDAAKAAELGREAIPGLKQLAEDGNGDATYLLGCLYMGAIGCERDFNAGLPLMEKAIRHGIPDALLSIAVFELSGGVQRVGLYELALGRMQEAADNGSVRAMYAYGKLLMDGARGSDGKGKGMEYMRKAAEHHHPLAEYTLAMACLNGTYGEPVNEAKAIRLLQDAAAQLEGVSCSTLAGYYMQGLHGCPQNLETACGLARAGVEVDDAMSYLVLGMVYTQSRYSLGTAGQAFACFKKAYEKDIPEGGALLGACYMKGLGVPQDRELAVRYWKEAARKGARGAQDALKQNGINW